jgi:hypothetical protein
MGVGMKVITMKMTGIARQAAKGQVDNVGNLTEVVLFLKLIDTTSRIQDLLRTGEERVALITNINGEFCFVRAHFKRVSARASHFTVNVIWMDIFLHKRPFQNGFCVAGNQPALTASRSFHISSETGALQRFLRDSSLVCTRKQGGIIPKKI